MIWATTHLWPFPRQCLESAIVLLDGELDGLAVGVEPDGELRLPPRIGDADEVPASPTAAVAVAERGHKGELLREALVKHAPEEESGNSL